MHIPETRPPPRPRFTLGRWDGRPPWPLPSVHRLLRDPILACRLSHWFDVALRAVPCILAAWLGVGLSTDRPQTAAHRRGRGARRGTSEAGKGGEKPATLKCESTSCTRLVAGACQRLSDTSRRGSSHTEAGAPAGAAGEVGTCSGTFLRSGGRRRRSPDDQAAIAEAASGAGTPDRTTRARGGRSSGPCRRVWALR